jgi:hypothetical protein
MSLLSPRFKSSSTLRNAANGVAIKQGARGRAVHLVQMALIDLGYPMPQSTGNPAYSPDGSFGNETRLKLIDYQTRNQLPKTGEIDKDTILKLDLQCRSYTHRVRLHFRSLALANVPFERSLQDAEIVFGQYGIKVEYASGQSLFLTPQEEAKFNSIGGSCDWEINTGEYNELHSMGVLFLHPRSRFTMSAHLTKRICLAVADMRKTGRHVPLPQMLRAGTQRMKFVMFCLPPHSIRFMSRTREI